MNLIVIKFSNEEWVVVPERNSIEDIVNLFTKLNIEQFRDLLKDNIIDDDNKKPNYFQLKKKYNIDEHTKIQYHEIL